MSGLFRLTAPCVHRFREKSSIFLTEVHPAGDPETRSAILSRLRKRDFDADHHCSAWRQGVPVSTQGSDDDGEPSGTAGPPMLRVLEGAGITDALAVCIRWFGGTRLGRGGLVRAYTEGVQGALEAARLQGLKEAVRLLRSGTLTAPAGQSHLPFATLGAFPEAEVSGQEFGPAGTKVHFRIPPERSTALEALWRERSRGGQIAWESAT